MKPAIGAMVRINKASLEWFVKNIDIFYVGGVKENESTNYGVVASMIMASFPEDVYGMITGRGADYDTVSRVALYLDGELLRTCYMENKHLSVIREPDEA